MTSVQNKSTTMRNTSPNNLVLGAGIAGISAAWHLQQEGQHSIILEKDDDWGGLCGYFVMEDFPFFSSNDDGGK